jgi:hypothetical protein
VPCPHPQVGTVNGSTRSASLISRQMPYMLRRRRDLRGGGHQRQSREVRPRRPNLPAAARAAEAIAANPEKSDRAIAEKIGVSPDTVNRVRNSTVRHRTVGQPAADRVGEARGQGREGDAGRRYQSGCVSSLRGLSIVLVEPQRGHRYVWISGMRSYSSIV